MLHDFLDSNRAELIERCRTKVARRPTPRPTPNEMEHGIPLFLGQLIETLRAEQPSGAPSARQAERNMPRELAAGAARHGHELLRRGFTVDQVVYDYGDLCQAVTELAVETNAPVSADEFHTLNRCLDDAIADAVTEFGWQRDRLISEEGKRATSERLELTAREMRGFLDAAMLSFVAIRRGGVGVNGATAAVLEKSLVGLRDLVDGALAQEKAAGAVPNIGRAEEA